MSSNNKITASEKKSIILVIPSISYGGAELQVLLQTHSLIQAGYSTYLLVTSDKIDTGLLSKYQIPESNVLKLNSRIYNLDMKSLWYSVRTAKTFRKLIAPYRPALLFANLPVSHFICRVAKLFDKSGIVLIPYHHSMQYEASPINTTGKKIFNYLNRLIAKKTDDGAICISQAVKDNIADNFFLANPEVIYNAIPEKTVSEKEAVDYCDKHGIKRKPFNIVVPGRLHHVKGQMFFVKAFAEWVSRYDISPGSINVVLAGGGNQFEAISAEIDRAGLRDFIHITGFVENTQLLSWIKWADLVVIPSLNEGLGIVAIECLMSGSLVLASQTGGLKEVILDGNNGFTFKTADEDDFIQKLNDIYNTKNVTLIDRDRIMDSYRQRFSFEIHLKQLEKLINSFGNFKN